MRPSNGRGSHAALAFAALSLALAGCGESGSTRSYSGTINNPGGPISTEAHKPTGARGDFAQGTEQGARAATVRVNRHAWRASLDAVSFMPLATSDPYGGAIATDWYVSQRSPNERLKVNILVGGPELRGDTVKVTVFRQERKGGRDWANAPVDPGTAQAMENAILQRARELRQQAGG
jgi:hypothetical protein